MEEDVKKSCLNMARYLCELCGLGIQLDHVEDITSNVIVFLFECITKNQIPDILETNSVEHEAHNIQAVIDTLSMDLIGKSLSHISGEMIINGNLGHLHNLLEIMVRVAEIFAAQPDFKFPLKKKRQPEAQRKMSVLTDSSGTSSSGKKYGLSDSTSTTEVFKNKRMIDKSSSINTDSTSSLVKSALQKPMLRRKPPSKARKPTRGSSMASSTSAASSVQYPCSVVRSKSKISESDVPSIFDEADKSKIEDFDESITDIEIPREKVTINLDKMVQVDIEIRPERETIQPDIMKRKISRLSSRRISERQGRFSKDVKIAERQGVEQLYEKNLKTSLKIVLEKSSLKTRASSLTRSHLRRLNRSATKRFPSCNTSYLLPFPLRRRSMSRTRSRSHSRFVPQSSGTMQNSQVLQNESKSSFLHEFLSVFPEVKLSPSMARNLSRKYEHHLLTMHKRVKSCLFTKPQIKIQAERAAEKQLAVSKLLQKDLLERQRVNEIKSHRRNENKISYCLRDARLKSARMKQFSDEFHIEYRKKLQKKSIAEEQILKNAFVESMKIQQEHVNRLCNGMEEARENDAHEYLNYLNSLDNLYRTQLAAFEESAKNERDEVEVQNKAKLAELRKMRKECEKALKEEIRIMQKVVIDSARDVHFRELDAENYVDMLRKRYT